MLSHFKEYNSSKNMKLNNLDIFQSIKLRIYADIILQISLKLNFTPSILGCYGLILKVNKLKSKEKYLKGRIFKFFCFPLHRQMERSNS